MYASINNTGGLPLNLIPIIWGSGTLAPEKNACRHGRRSRMIKCRVSMNPTPMIIPMTNDLGSIFIFYESSVTLERSGGVYAVSSLDWLAVFLMRLGIAEFFFLLKYRKTPAVDRSVRVPGSGIGVTYVRNAISPPREL